MKIFKNINQDTKNTESEVLNKLDYLFNDWKIWHLNNKEELISFLFRIYFYKRTYRPYIPLLDYIFRLIILLLVIILFYLSIYWSLFFHQQWVDLIYKEKWILISNVTYFILALYIPVRIYSYIRLILRNEIKKDYWYIYWIWFLKFLLFTVFISFTWFIWNMFWSIYNILDVSIKEFFK